MGDCEEHLKVYYWQIIIVHKSCIYRNITRATEASRSHNPAGKMASVYSGYHFAELLTVSKKTKSRASPTFTSAIPFITTSCPHPFRKQVQSNQQVSLSPLPQTRVPHPRQTRPCLPVAVLDITPHSCPLSSSPHRARTSGTRL